MERTAVITITPDGPSKIDIQTGEVTTLEILDYLKTVSQHFSREVLREYTEMTGDKNPDASKLDEYMAFLRKNKL